MPIYATNRTAANGKIIYEIRNEDGTVAHEIFEGMTVKTGQEFGIVGGRGTQKDGTLNDHLFSAHSHLEYSVAGHNIDLRTLVASWGIKNVVAQDETSKEIPVRWDSNTGLWMSDALGLAFDRSSQLGTSKIFGSWIAWSTDPAQRQQVKWDSNNNGWFWWDTTTNDWKRNSINERLKWMKMNDVFAFQSAQ